MKNRNDNSISNNKKCPKHAKNRFEKWNGCDFSETIDYSPQKIPLSKGCGWRVVTRALEIKGLAKKRNQWFKKSVGQESIAFGALR